MVIGIYYINLHIANSSDFLYNFPPTENVNKK